MSPFKTNKNYNGGDKEHKNKGFKNSEIIKIADKFFIAFSIFACLFLLHSMTGYDIKYIDHICISFFISFIGFFVFFYRRLLLKYVENREESISKLEKNLEGEKNHSYLHNQQIKHLIESTNVCPWSANLQNNSFIYVGPQISSMTKIEADEWLKPSFLMGHIYQEDHKIMFSALRKLKHGGFVTIEYRILSPNNEIIWVRNSMCMDKKGDNEIYLQGFLTDITEQKEVENALRKARFEAEKANKTKSNFLASMSHELRTPLNSIIGFSEIMHTEAFGPLGQERYKEYSINICESGRHLLELINDILDYSKIEAGKFNVVKEHIEISNIFHSCEVLVKQRALQKGICFNIMTPDEEVMLNVDSKRIKQVIINLLTNAIKFTPNGGNVSLEYKKISSDMISIIISDTGVGIKPEDIDNICEQFHQVNAEANRDQEGTGLGLAISKSLVEMHEGELKIDSVYGHGTKVSIFLPIEEMLEINNESKEDEKINPMFLKGTSENKIYRSG